MERWAVRQLEPVVRVAGANPAALPVGVVRLVKKALKKLRGRVR